MLVTIPLTFPSPDHLRFELERVLGSRWGLLDGHLADALASKEVESLISAKLPQLQKDLESFRRVVEQHAVAEKQCALGI